MTDRRLTQTKDEFIAEDLEQMLSAINYNDWIYSMIEPYFGKNIIEIGAGIGTVTRKIIQKNIRITAVEPNENCQRHLLKDYSNNPNFSLIPSKIEDCKINNELLGKFDTLICINVLEHIKDDLDSMMTFNKILKNGGYVLLIVPALSMLFGPIDKSVGHYRRYSKKDLQSLFSNSSFEIEKIYYFNFVGSLGWFVNSHILKIESQKESQISLMDKLVPFLSSIESVIHPPIGMSLFVAARKK